MRKMEERKKDGATYEESRRNAVLFEVSLSTKSVDDMLNILLEAKKTNMYFINRTTGENLKIEELKSFETMEEFSNGIIVKWSPRCQQLAYMIMFLDFSVQKNRERRANMNMEMAQCTAKEQKRKEGKANKKDEDDLAILD